MILGTSNQYLGLLAIWWHHAVLLMASGTCACLQSIAEFSLCHVLFHCLLVCVISLKANK
jgi:hypothetical protein